MGSSHENVLISPLLLVLWLQIVKTGHEKQSPWSRDCKTPSIHVSVCVSVRSSRFYINLNISFSYKDNFTKFAGNVYGYKKLSLQNFGLFEKQNGRHSQLFEDHKDALNLEIFQLASSNISKIYS